MKNKKAFTVTEILAALVILSIIIAIAIPSVTKLQQKFRNNYYTELDSSLLMASKEYYKNNLSKRPINILYSSGVDYEYLSLDKELKGFRNDTVDGRVVVVKLENNYFYKNCLVVNGTEQKYKTLQPIDDTNGLEFDMSKYEDNICYFNSYFNDDGTLDTTKGDKIEEKSEINNDLYIHISNDYDVQQIKKLTSASKYIERIDEANRILYRVKIGTEMIPTNITEFNEVVKNSIGDFELKYDLLQSNIRNVKVFQHESPKITIADNPVTGNEITYTDNASLTKLICNKYGDTWQADYHSHFDGCEIKINDNKWENFNSDQIAGKIKSGDKVKFRVIGHSDVGDGIIENVVQYGKESTEYSVVGINNITITFDVNDGDAWTNTTCGFNFDNGNCYKTIKANDKYGDLPIPKKKGYTFNGWYTTKTGGNKVGVDTSSGEQDITLYAHWKLLEYNIVYDYQGGIAGEKAPTSAKWNEIIEISNPVKNGYEFLGWRFEKFNNDAEYSDNINFVNPKKVLSNFASNKSKYFRNLGSEATDAKLKAIWEEKTQYITLTYDSKGGTTCSSQTKIKGSSFDINCNTNRDGYTFNGWTENSNGTGTKYYYGNTITVDKDTTLYAQWENEVIPVYKITLDPDGGSGGTTAIYEKYGVGLYYDKECTNPITSRINIPFKKGNQFLHYYGYIGSDGSYGANLTNDGNYKAFESDTILYASWQPNIYTITLNQNGGSGGTTAIYQKYGVGLYLDRECTISIGNRIITPSKDGNKFLYYYGYIGSDGSYGTNLTGNGNYDAFNSNTTLTAQWEPAIYKITLDPTGGSGGTTAIYEKYGVGLYLDQNCTIRIGSKIEVPRRSGYNFVDYPGYIGSDGSYGANLTNSNNYKSFKKDTTLYARWDGINETITLKASFNKSDGTNYTTNTWSNKPVTATIIATSNNSNISLMKYTASNYNLSSSWEYISPKSTTRTGKYSINYSGVYPTTSTATTDLNTNYSRDFGYIKIDVDGPSIVKNAIRIYQTNSKGIIVAENKKINCGETFKMQNVPGYLHYDVSSISALDYHSQIESFIYTTKLTDSYSNQELQDCKKTEGHTKCTWTFKFTAQDNAGNVEILNCPINLTY